MRGTGCSNVGTSGPGGGKGSATTLPTRPPRTLFRKFVHAMADVVVDEVSITVCYGRRANNPFPVKNGFADTECSIPWLGNRKLRLLFGDKPPQVVTS